MFPHSIEAPDEIWLQSALWFLRRCVKMVAGQQTTDDVQQMTDGQWSMTILKAPRQPLALGLCQGWSGGAKVSCSIHYRSVQLILAYSWARPATLVAGKGRRGMFLFLLFLHFHSCSPFFPVLLFLLLYYFFYLFSPFFWETTQNDPQGLTCR